MAGEQETQRVRWSALVALTAMATIRPMCLCTNALTVLVLTVFVFVLLRLVVALVVLVMPVLVMLCR